VLDCGRLPTVSIRSSFPQAEARLTMMYAHSVKLELTVGCRVKKNFKVGETREGSEKSTVCCCVDWIR
jgi:hypothetical protein